MNSRELITRYSAYFVKSPQTHVLRQDLSNTGQLQDALSKGEQSSDFLSSSVNYKTLSQEHIWATGLSMLSSGKYIGSGRNEQMLNPREAGKVLRAILNVGAVSDSPQSVSFNYDAALLEIQRTNIDLPYHIQREARRDIDKTRVHEFQGYIFTLLADGYIDLYPPYDGYK